MTLADVGRAHHGPGVHVDPDEEAFARPEIIFTLGDRWAVNGRRGRATADGRMVVLGNAGDPYTCRHFDPVPRDTTLFVQFHTQAVEAAFHMGGWVQQPLFPVQAVRLTPRLAWYRDELLNELATRRPGFQLAVDALTAQLLVSVTRRVQNGVALGTPTEPGRDVSERLEHARAYVDAHIAEDLDLLTLARVADLSPFHFSRQFKAHVGLSPHQYLLRRRLQYAAFQLRETRVTVTEVAHAAGFQDARHFARMFRRHTGMVPSAYRTHSARFA